MSRITLAPRRASTTVKVRYADVEGLRLDAYLTYSKDEAGAVREVFVSAGKVGTSGSASLRDAGLLISLLLQRGATLDEIKAMLTRGPQDQPASQVGVVIDTLCNEQALA